MDSTSGTAATDRGDRLETTPRISLKTRLKTRTRGNTRVNTDDREPGIFVARATKIARDREPGDFDRGTDATRRAARGWLTAAGNRSSSANRATDGWCDPKVLVTAKRLT